ncbi:Aste57867_21596 [Aphanomyces stellatus]|uniref:Aste57867_21596 protein n=1 Tax=Aphanomyces stellatus TaxID=120398 RepID=A0A485LHX5_9STRA|nr:hypothetical protein As57867_021527 [Aphanomyces stellatus]VFT98266.1 Aste57867_21596 [Aphanomyces stellatus]
MLREFTKTAVGKVEPANVTEGDVVVSTKANAPPGDHVRCIELHFKSPPVNFSHISFQNFYTAALRIDQVVQGRCETILDNFPLMQHVHFEDDAQNWHILKRDELGSALDPAHVEQFIFYLLQPSPLWDKWELRSIKIFETNQVAAIVPKALVGKPETSMHMYRKYTVNTSGVALDSKDISGHASRFMDLLGLLQTKLAKTTGTTK